MAFLREYVRSEPFRIHFVQRVIPVDMVVDTNIDQIKEGAKQLGLHIGESETFKIRDRRARLTLSEEGAHRRDRRRRGQEGEPRVSGPGDTGGGPRRVHGALPGAPRRDNQHNQAQETILGPGAEHGRPLDHSQAVRIDPSALEDFVTPLPGQLLP